MPNENNAIADFLNDVSEPQDIFVEAKSDVQEEVENKEDKSVPFHRDPKVQRYVEKQIEKALKNVAPLERTSITEVVPSDVKDVIGAFTAIIGNDTPDKVKALEALEKTLNGADERASSKAIERFKQEQTAALTRKSVEEKAAQDELDTYFDDIEETYDVDLSSNAASAKKLRSEFIEYVRKIAPKDEKGEVKAFPDLLSAFEIFQEQGKKTVQPTRAKELASRGMTRSGDTSGNAPRGYSWKDVDKFFDTLKT